MGVVTYDFEVTSPISPARLFKAVIVDAGKVFPKAAPQAVKSVELQGNGGPGSIAKINFAEVDRNSLPTQANFCSYNANPLQAALPFTAVFYSTPAVRSIQGYPHIISQAQNHLMTPNMTGSYGGSFQGYSPVISHISNPVLSSSTSTTASTVYTPMMSQLPPVPYVKHEIESHDQNNFPYSYSVIEGGPLGDKLEKISFKNKLVAGAYGGSVCKSLMKFYTISDCVFTEEEIKDQIQRMDVVYKAVETYLVTNPDVCN
ncbi:hypothetical protein V6N11_064432 [Hibiscus sabdariffa]|uniref:Bet v I/Major latex protein domain-containing protein n=2 Tax=Hibiscus sabdariffa TaxID=183260 RepID=A0ABR2P9G4_9ROSI